MPELPEVETTCRGIRATLLKQTIQQVIVRERRLRYLVCAHFEEKITQQKIVAVNRRAKYLLVSLEKGTIVIHLGMSGHLRVVKNSPQITDKHNHIDICLSNQYVLKFTDPRRFGLVLYIESPLDDHKLFKHLGPEPLTDAFCADYLYQKAQNKKVAIKNFLMDNTVVVGVGNIYAQESLFKAGISPKRHAKQISLKRYSQLVAAVKEILQSAIAKGGTSLKDFYKADGKPGYFQQSLMVYGRADNPCVQCNRLLKSQVIAGRNSTYCTHCQH